MTCTRPPQGVIFAAVLSLVVLCRLAISADVGKLELTYATVGQSDLKLDLYLPEQAAEPRDKDSRSPNAAAARRPVIVWVHGGAWRSGSRQNVPILGMLERGYAIASVDYRLSPEARFPAQIHDIKAAIRFLRSHADEYQLDSQRISVVGASAGGHLAALVGVSQGVAALEGNVGEDAATSSAVNAIVSFYGASNLQTILAQSTPHGLSVRVPALELLLGGQPETHAAVAELASPVAHVDPTDPPLLLIHGDQDPQMPINQSHELQGKYQSLGLPVTFHVVHGAAHGGEAFYTSTMLDRVAEFLKR